MTIGFYPIDEIERRYNILLDTGKYSKNAEEILRKTIKDLDKIIEGKRD